jgi:hypothetical protein
MFGKKKDVTVKLDQVENRLLDEMIMYGPDSTSYPDWVGYLERVGNLRKSQDKRVPNPDTIALVAGNLLGILIIVAYEQKHVMTSKGLGFVMKSK